MERKEGWVAGGGGGGGGRVLSGARLRDFKGVATALDKSRAEVARQPREARRTVAGFIVPLVTFISTHMLRCARL